MTQITVDEWMDELSMHERIQSEAQIRQAWKAAQDALRSPAPAATVTGWRLLEVGEVIQAGDEFWDDNVEEWCLADRRIYDKTDNDWPFRRRLTPPALTDAMIDAIKAELPLLWEYAPNIARRIERALSPAAARGAGGEG